MSIDLPAIPQITAVLRKDDSSAFADKSDLTYRKFDNLILNGATSIQSLLTGSIFTNALINKCDFSRSDFEGAQISNSVITNSSFVNCDVRSCRFGNSSFVCCDFSGALLSYCEFDQCEFRDCKFNEAIISELIANKSIFENCQNRMATITHGEYYQCNFINMKFADSTFLLHILDGCSFVDCAMNVDSLGAIYGVTEQEISTLKLFYLGEEQNITNPSDLITKLFDEFSRRRWQFKLIMLAWNTGKVTTISALRAILSAYKGHINEGILLQTEELRFVRRITEHLRKTSKMPLIAAMDSYEGAVALASIASTSGGQPHAELSLLAMYLLKAVDGMRNDLERLVGDYEDNSDNYANVTVVMKFDKQPLIGSADLINTFAVLFGFPSSARLIKAKSGSYIEWVQMTVAGLFAFRLILFAINGCIKEINGCLKETNGFIKETNVIINSINRSNIERPKKKGNRQLAQRTRAATKLITLVRSNDTLTDPVIKDYGSNNIKECKVTTEDHEDSEKHGSKPRERPRRRVRD